jgi:dTDP-4-dehydrorhamnose 3,5-epimerase
MKIVEKYFDNVFVIECDVFKDSRGYFFESYNEKSFKQLGIDYDFVQDNHSYSTKNVLRGLHYQSKNPQGKLVRCVRGKILDCFVDMRLESTTLGQWNSVELNEHDKKMIWIPPGFAHGFLTLSDECEFLYKVTEFRYKEYERTLSWKCPMIGIDWNLRESPILSEKDENGLNFIDCMREIDNDFDNRWSGIHRN